MPEAADHIFKTQVTESVEELMPEYGSKVFCVEPCDAPEPAANAGTMVAGIIGFTGEQFGGIVAVQTSPKVVFDTVPPAIRSRMTEERVVLDWVGELANQLLGRTKNKMLRYSASYQMSPPTAVSGHELNVVPAESSGSQWLRIATETGEIYLMIDFRTEGELMLSPSDDANRVAAAEGDLMLF